jgi:hypothetical protein
MEQVKNIILSNFERQKKRMREEFEKTDISKIYLMAFNNYFSFCEKDILKQITEMEQKDENYNKN